jgi:hypothetical protein
MTTAFLAGSEICGERGYPAKLGAMRKLIVALVLCGACDGSKPANRALAEWEKPRPLPKPTAEQKAAVAQPAATPVPPVENPEDALVRRILTGTATVPDIIEMMKTAEANSKRITFAHLKKGPDKYKGEPWAFRGKILEIAEVDGHTRARVAIDSYGQKAIYVEAGFTTDFVEDNTVDIVGLLWGSFSYKSQAGWDMSIPALYAAKIAKRGELDPRSKPRRAAVGEDE